MRRATVSFPIFAPYPLLGAVVELLKILNATVPAPSICPRLQIQFGLETVQFAWRMRSPAVTNWSPSLLFQTWCSLRRTPVRPFIGKSSILHSGRLSRTLKPGAQLTLRTRHLGPSLGWIPKESRLSALHGQLVPGTARRPQPQKKANDAGIRRDLEELRGAAYTDEEWADAKYRLVSLAKLVRRWTKAA